MDSRRGGEDDFATVTDGNSMSFVVAGGPGLKTRNLIWTNCNRDTFKCNDAIKCNAIVFQCSITVESCESINTYIKIRLLDY